MYEQTRMIDRQIAALEAQKLRLLTLPEDKFEEGDVVWFTKSFGPNRYTYAALKHARHWYVTQGGHSRQDRMSWDHLLDFVGDGEMWAATEWEQLV